MAKTTTKQNTKKGEKTNDHQDQPRICIIGAGMSGVLMAIKLKEAGYTELTILEKAAAVGGTWRDNTYPGLHCDVPSYSYCYTFAPSTNWEKRMSKGEDIKKYFEDTSERYGVTELVKFNTEVVDASYKGQHWQVQTNHGDNLVFDFVISATGVLHHPVIPEFKGKELFKGDSFHTARWDHSVDLKNKRVGIIGTGSTAAQLIKPLAKECKEIVNFQRTAQWIFPFPNREYNAIDKLLAKRIPGYHKLVRRVYDEAFDHGGQAVTVDGWQRRLIQAVCRLNLKLSVRDKALRKKLTPDYQPLCKRMVMSDNYYQAIQKSNVELEVESIDQIEANGIRLKDGRLHELDVIVFSTGFDTQAYIRPMKMNGLNDMTLDKAWAKGPTAYRTIAMPDFPNFFMIQGPNAPVGNFSLVSTAESQSKYILKCINMFRAGKFKSIMPSHSACDKFNAELVDAMEGTVWLSGCDSWYISDAGIPLSWPWGPREFRDSMREPKMSEYVLDEGVEAPKAKKAQLKQVN